MHYYLLPALTGVTDIELKGFDEFLRLSPTKIQINGTEYELKKDKRNWADNFGFQLIERPQGNYLSVLKISPPDLSLELSRYRTVKKISKMFTEDRDESWRSYEIKNILERWLLALANDGGDGDPIFSLSYEKSPANSKMKSEFIEKGMNGDHYVQLILSSVTKMKNNIIKDPITITIKDNVGIIVKDSMSIDIDTLPLPQNKLLSLMKQNPNKEDLTAMMLRYASLLPGGQQWSVPKSIYEYLMTNYKVDVEAFASPLNSQIRELGGNFCSLFLDTDAKYGSIGNFFDLSLRGRKAIINPPFVESLLEKVADKIINDKALSKSSLLFIIIPEWKDASFYKKFKNANKYLFDFSLIKGNYHYVDYENKIIKANFNSHVYILGGEDYKKIKWIDIRKELLRLWGNFRI